MSDFEEKLINAVRSREFIYDKTKKSYRLPELKEAAWRQIAVETGATAQECERRWSSLRDRFGKELRRLEAPSGSKAASTAPWHLMESMMFLKDHIVPRKCRTSKNILEESRSAVGGEEDDIFTEADVSDCEFISPPTKRQKKTDIFTEADVSDCEFISPPTKRQKKTAEVQEHFKEAVGALKELVARRKPTAEPVQDPDVYHILKAAEAKITNIENKHLKRAAALDVLNFAIAMEDFAEGVSQNQPRFRLD